MAINNILSHLPGAIPAPLQTKATAQSQPRQCETRGVGSLWLGLRGCGEECAIASHAGGGADERGTYNTNLRQAPRGVKAHPIDTDPVCTPDPPDRFAAYLLMA